MELLSLKYNGKAKHTDLMNKAHMKRREFREITESLIEREAIWVENYKSRNGVTGKMYVLDTELFGSWNNTKHK